MKQPGNWQHAVITRVEQRTPGIKSYFLHVPLARPRAGQHVDVRLTAPDGYQAQRSYSIASAPGADEIELAVELLKDGELSSYFHDVAQVGDVIEVRGPLGGHFVWSAADGGPLLLVAGGSGIVPLMAIAREWRTAAPHVPALLLYSASSWDAMAFREELQDIENAHPEFFFTAAITRGPATRASDFARRIDAAMVRQLLSRWGQSPQLVYVCGANAFVEAASAALTAQGVPARQIRTERYGGLTLA